MHRSCLALIVFTVTNIGLAQESSLDVRKEIEALRQGQETILKDLNEIKSLLKQRIPAPNVPKQNVQGVEFDIANNPILGNPAAKLILIELTDYECQFCGQYTRETLPQILKRYVEGGKMAYAMIDMPLPGHKNAPKAAEAAYCANEQGKYWEMHDKMMKKQESLGDLTVFAESLNLNIPQFENCLNANKYAENVAGNIALGLKLGISGVPGFIFAIRDTEKLSKVKGISSSIGFRTFTAFQPEIDQALANLLK
jgi:protein-disulfide isomerase